jgi:hypothetical protein
MKEYLAGTAIVLPVLAVSFTIVASINEHPWVMAGAVVVAAFSALSAVMDSRKNRDQSEDIKVRKRRMVRLSARKKTTKK